MSDYVEPLKDNDLMPFGKYKGKPMVTIPDSYLYFIYHKGGLQHQGVKKYIMANLASIEKSVSNQPKKW